MADGKFAAFVSTLTWNSVCNVEFSLRARSGTSVLVHIGGIGILHARLRCAVADFAAPSHVAPRTSFIVELSEVEGATGCTIFPTND